MQDAAFTAFASELEEHGEHRVRLLVEQGRWVTEPAKHRQAAEWLTTLERDRARRQEQLLERSVNAAERSATASEKSARFAMWSSIVALLTVGVTVLGSFLVWLLR